MKRLAVIILCLFSALSAYSQRTVRYDLYVNDTIVNYSGKDRHAISINGSIPAPTLYFTEGDTAEIFVHNNLDEETSIHWHGLILPNSQDGVPYLTTAPIKAHTTYKYSFPLVQSGTLWYHSHTKLQEQSGMYGAFIIHKRNEKPMPEYVMVLSDWTNERPHEVDRSLHSATDWYAIKKNSTQDYFQSVKDGHLGTKFKNEWKRMLAMDVSDVYYDRMFINGKTDDAAPQFKPGQKVRLRIINGGSSTYFWLNYGGGKITVVASDGVDVEPVEVDRMIIAVSETYDVIITIPPDGIANEFTATAEDRTKHASLWLGNGIRRLETPLPRLKYFEGMKMMNGMMTLGGDMKPMGMVMHDQIMDMNTVMYPEISGEPKNKKEKPDSMGMSHAGHTMNKTGIVTLNYTMLKSPTKTTLPYDSTRTMRFELTGNMNRYVWTIDNKTVSEADKILIKKGENIRIIIYNNSMMRHPMHLHGHYFRLLNGQGEFSPLKNIIDIMPMETDTIEFAATESGDWFFHCHILYHMMSGMGRIFTYADSPPNPEIPNPKKSLRKLFQDDRMFHPMGQISLESNGSDGEFMLMNTRWFIQTEWRVGINTHHGFESESHIGRYFGKMQFFRVYTGWDFRYRTGQEPERNIFNQANTKDRRQVVCFGIQYVLPFLILADFRVDQTGRVRLQLEREDIPVTKRLRLGWMVNSDFEYMAGARYILTKYFSVSTHYDSDMGWGGGITITY